MGLQESTPFDRVAGTLDDMTYAVGHADGVEAAILIAMTFSPDGPPGLCCHLLAAASRGRRVFQGRPQGLGNPQLEPPWVAAPQTS